LLRKAVSVRSTSPAGQGAKALRKTRRTIVAAALGERVVTDSQLEAGNPCEHTRTLRRYTAHHPDGYGYSRFRDHYVEWRHGITAIMRQTHAAGEKLFVDFAGDTMPVFDGLTGGGARRQDLRRGHGSVELHIRPSSGSARRCPTGSAPMWMCLTFPGEVPKALVCDNLKTG
jgi:transposase